MAARTSEALGTGDGPVVGTVSRGTRRQVGRQTRGDSPTVLLRLVQAEGETVRGADAEGTTMDDELDRPDGRTPQEQVDGVRKRLLGIETRTVDEMVDEIQARTLAQAWARFNDRQMRVETAWPSPLTTGPTDDD